MTGLEAAISKLQMASSGKQDRNYKLVAAKRLSSCRAMLIHLHPLAIFFRSITEFKVSSAFMIALLCIC